MLDHIADIAQNSEDHIHLPWDPLREQDWTSLGLEPSDDVAWDLCDEGTSPTSENILKEHDHSSSLRMQPKVCLQFSPVAVDTVVDCFWDNLGFTLPSGNAKHFAGPQDDSVRGGKLSPYSASFQSSLSVQPLSHDSDASGASTSCSGNTPPDSFDFQDSDSILPAIPDSDSALLHSQDIVLGDMCSQTCPPDSSLFFVQLFVTAIGEGPLMPDITVKMRGVLEQVRRKAAKEHGSAVRLTDEGCVDLKMRVFVANSVEASAVNEYIASHPNQSPAPFVILSKQLRMAVSYDPAAINPSVSSVGDRLRKQMKTHAVKVLREAMGSAHCGVTTTMLRGHCGPYEAAEHVMPVVLERAVQVGDDDESLHIVLPAKNNPRPPPRDRPASPKPPRALPLPLSINTALPPSWAMSPDAGSLPSTPLAREEDDPELRLSSHFPVSLFVTAIADGHIAMDTPQKVQERLAQIVSKVPKEQNTTVEVLEGATVELKMRVFVVNSEDAKAVGDYINAHLDQLPAPFVVLARHLPMAVLYDPATLDLSDASVADRLRKQAKTRAVKVLREAIGNKALGVTRDMLRGHQGALAPAEHLADALAALTRPVATAGKDDAARFMVFPARNKSAAASPRSGPASPRKRSAAEMAAAHAHDGPAHAEFAPPSPRMRAGAAGGNRRGGAASASHLHRDMLDKVLKKVRRDSDPPDTL